MHYIPHILQNTQELMVTYRLKEMSAISVKLLGSTLLLQNKTFKRAKMYFIPQQSLEIPSLQLVQKHKKHTVIVKSLDTLQTFELYCKK